MRKSFPFFAIALICAASTYAAANSNYAILRGAVAEKALHQCSRPVPAGITGTWDPPEEAIRQLEDRLPQLARLAATNQRGVDKSIGDAAASRRQYIGVVIANRHYIYINAWTSKVPLTDRTRQAWQSKANVVCDGGPAYWGALYDPATGTFSDLEGNGLA